MTDLATLVERSLADGTAEQFNDRVDTQAANLHDAIAAGELDNEDFSVGLEMEVYAVDNDGRLAPLPDAVFGSAASKELGVHNAEINTDPDVLDTDGLSTQAESIERQFERARETAQQEGLDLVLDAMWTRSPEEGAYEYLTAHDDSEGFVVAENMRTDSRYVAIDNEVRRHAGGDISFAVPGISEAFPTILFESLATSIQPHLQIPSAEQFPAYYNTAIRTLGPLLALSTNSPFLPPDLYDEMETPHDVVEESHHELRIAVFEQSVNESPNPKVRVPDDIDSVGETVDGVVADDLFAPFLREWLDDSDRETFADRFWEFDYKRSTYWRWLRCVVGGDAVEGAGDERSLRIEYRPIPTQPTIRDVVGMQCLTVGLIRGLVAADHPIVELPWADAEESFYSAASDGLDAELAWITAEGERTSDSSVIFSELFAYAREGLDTAGVPADDAEQYLAPIEARVDAGLTPSMWKKARVREALDDGHSFAEAVDRMQRQYIERSRETASFAQWL